MVSVIILAFIAALGFWLYAECMLGRIARLVFGVLFIGVVVILTYACSTFPQALESAWHRNSIKAASDLLAKGETNRVQRAFGTYNVMVTTTSTFRASEEMWHILKQDTTH